MKREKEAETVACMIQVHCRGVHGSKRGLCSDCKALLGYAESRLSKCIHGDEKPFCSSCTTHCYKPDMREKIAQVMRYSGPRMLLHHPIVAIRHMVATARKKGCQPDVG